MPPMRGSTRSCRVRTSRHPPANASKPSRLEFGHDVQLFCIVTVDSDSCARLPKQTSRARRPTRVARIRLARSTSGRDFVERFFRDGAVQVECSLKGRSPWTCACESKHPVLEPWLSELSELSEKLSELSGTVGHCRTVGLSDLSDCRITVGHCRILLSDCRTGPLIFRKIGRLSCTSSAL